MKPQKIQTMQHQKIRYWTDQIIRIENGNHYCDQFHCRFGSIQKSRPHGRTALCALAGGFGVAACRGNRSFWYFIYCRVECFVSFFRWPLFLVKNRSEEHTSE